MKAVLSAESSGAGGVKKKMLRRFKKKLKMLSVRGRRDLELT